MKAEDERQKDYELRHCSIQMETVFFQLKNSGFSLFAKKGQKSGVSSPQRKSEVFQLKMQAFYW